MSLDIKLEAKELENAIKRNPRFVSNETKRFLTKAQYEIRSGITQDKWAVGAGGGGVPIATGNLKYAHKYRIEPFQFSVVVDKNKTRAGNYNYANIVHSGTKYMDARPWMSYVFKKKKNKIKSEGDQLLKRIVKNLSR